MHERLRPHSYNREQWSRGAPISAPIKGSEFRTHPRSSRPEAVQLTEGRSQAWGALRSPRITSDECRQKAIFGKRHRTFDNAELKSRMLKVMQSMRMANSITGSLDMVYASCVPVHQGVLYVRSRRWDPLSFLFLLGFPDLHLIYITTVILFCSMFNRTWVRPLFSSSPRVTRSHGGDPRYFPVCGSGLRSG